MRRTPSGRAWSTRKLPRLAKGIERLTEWLAAVDDDGVAAAIQGELKAMVTDRKAVEARLLALEADSRALADQAAEVERLREAWQGWAGALEDGVRGEALQVRARALIKKALVTPLYLRRDEAGGWLFAGLFTYERGNYREAYTRLKTSVERLPAFTPFLYYYIRVCRVLAVPPTTEEKQYEAQVQRYFSRPLWFRALSTQVLRYFGRFSWVRRLTNVPLFKIRCKWCGRYTPYVHPDTPTFGFAAAENSCRAGCGRMYPMPSWTWDSPDGRAYSYYRVRSKTGGLGADGFTIREYPEAADRDRLFLQMVNALGLDDTATPRRHRVVTFEAPRPIAGSSDAPVQDGQSTDTAPHTPHRSSRPGEAGALLVIPTRSRLAKDLLQALHALGDGALGGPKGRGRRGRRAGGETDVDLGGLAGHHLDLAHLRGITRVRHEQAIGAFLHRAAHLAARRRQRRDQRILGCQQLEHGIDHRLA